MLGLYSAWLVKVALLEVASKKGDSAKYGSTASETFSDLVKGLRVLWHYTRTGVGVNATHFLRLGGSPLNFIERWLLCHCLRLGVDTNMWMLTGI